MNPRIPYHVLNTVMIAGGVGFMLNMLNAVDFLMQFKVIHFLGLIGGAIFLKLAYGLIQPKINDPITTHSLSKRFFFLSMAILATALVMRNYHVPYYNIFLYLDIAMQLAALGISFSPAANQMDLNEEILDA